MTSAPFFLPARRHAAVLALCLASAGLYACSGEIQCTSEITDGSASFKGAAVGKEESETLKRESVRDACRQRCAAQKAPMIDACSAACVTDVEAHKLGAKTSCGRR